MANRFAAIVDELDLISAQCESEGHVEVCALLDEVSHELSNDAPVSAKPKTTPKAASKTTKTGSSAELRAIAAQLKKDGEPKLAREALKMADALDEEEAPATDEDKPEGDEDSPADEDESDDLDDDADDAPADEEDEPEEEDLDAQLAALEKDLAAGSDDDSESHDEPDADDEPEATDDDADDSSDEPSDDSDTEDAPEVDDLEAQIATMLSALDSEPDGKGPSDEDGMDAEDVETEGDEPGAHDDDETDSEHGDDGERTDDELDPEEEGEDPNADPKSEASVKASKLAASRHIRSVAATLAKDGHGNLAKRVRELSSKLR